MTKGVGNWEKHTKGIGAKLLLQVCIKQQQHRAKIHTYIVIFNDLCH